MAQHRTRLCVFVVVLAAARPAAAQTDPRATFPAVSEACTACHRAFAREAPVIKP